MNRFTWITALAALAFAASATAADFSYHYIDTGLIVVDADNDGKGLGLAGSTNLPQLYRNATVFGAASYVDFAGGGMLNLETGLGVHWPVARVIDFNGGVSLDYLKFTRAGGSDLGFGLNAGLRAVPVSPRWELDGGLRYVKFGDAVEDVDGIGAVLGTRYTFKPGMSAGIQFTSGEFDMWTLSLRWEL